MEINKIILFMPFFLGIVFIEWFISRKYGDHKYKLNNSVNNIGLGLIDQLGGIFYLALMYIVFDWVYQHFAIFTIGSQWYWWVIALIAVDFVFYCYHRVGHEVNFFWAGHITHHQSEEFNLTVGFRLSVFQAINRTIFYSLLPILGFPPLMIVICFKILGVYTFFLHSQYIPKLGILEKILITPSAHRVHHGKNEQYLDKNYGGIFVIWDKIFKTYEEENEPVEYGILSLYQDKNPWHAMFHHYIHIWETWQYLSKPMDKFKLLFKGPTWHYEIDQEVGFTSAKTVEKVDDSSKAISNYAIYLLITSLTCFAGIVTFKDFIPFTEMSLYFFFTVSSTIVSGHLLNNKLAYKLLKYEKRRLILFATLFILVFLIFQNWYSLIGLIMVATSFAFNRKINES